TEMQGLDAGDGEEGVEGRQRRAKVAQADGAAGDGEGHGAEGVGEDEAMIGAARLGYRREAARLLPVEPARIHDDAADGIAVTGEKFGEAVDHDVRAMLDGAAEIGG